MPEAMPPATGAQPGQPPGQPQGQPFGANPAMGATPNKGFEAAGLQKLGVLVKEMESLLPMVGAASDIGKDLLKSLSLLTKHIPAGAVSPASQRNVMQDMMQRAQQNGAMQQQLDKSRMQPPGGGGAPAAAGAG